MAKIWQISAYDKDFQKHAIKNYDANTVGSPIFINASRFKVYVCLNWRICVIPDFMAF